MSYALWLLFFYVLGGITLIPVACLCIFVFLYWSLPKVEVEATQNTLKSQSIDDISSQYSPRRSGSDVSTIQSFSESSGVSTGVERSLTEQSLDSSISRAQTLDSTATSESFYSALSAPSLSIEREHETGVDAHITGWLTVSREYFIYPTGGPNNSGNPPQPASNAALLTKNESAYSTLYKLMSNNASKFSSSSSNGSPQSSSASTPTSSSNNGSNSSPTPKKSRLSKYFAVLRHGNLFLYNDADQQDVKHVVVIAHHVVTMWPPHVSDGELFAKRSAICLVKIPLGHDSVNDSDFDMAKILSDSSKPPKNAFFLYSDFCSEKEDFYFALIRASKRYNIHSPPPQTTIESRSSVFNPIYMAHPLHYKTSNMMDLIQTLHSTDANIQTRWLNALLGRLFLSVNRTSSFESYFRNKIITKLTRTKRPSFLSEIQVTKISSGDSIPYFTNPRLVELTPEGRLTVESDLAYSGNFSLEITTKAIINLGSRFKTREVTIALSITLQRLEGKLVLKVKPPPSDRLWYAFETMPKISLLVEPIVSSRQITYSVITKAIENRIREAIKETLVLPYLDDLAFFNTENEVFRGGIWDPSVKPSKSAEPASPTPEPSFDETPVSPILPVTDPGEIPPSGTPTPISVSVSSSSVNLRHRKTTPDLRSSPSSSHDLTLDHHSTMPPDPSSPSKNGGKLNDSLDESKSKKSFDITQHIGELHTQGTRSGDFKSLSRSDTKSTIVGTVKKWGNWYFKDRRNSNTGEEPYVETPPHNHPKRDFSSESLRRKSTPVLSSKLERKLSGKGNQHPNRQFKDDKQTDSSKPLSAPLPHSFPPELMDAISNQGDMVDSIISTYAPENGPAKDGISRSKSMKETRRKSQVSRTRDSQPKPKTPKSELDAKIDKKLADSTEDDSKHHANPSLKLLKKTTIAAAVTVPSVTDADISDKSPSTSIKIPNSKKTSAVSSLSSSLSSSGSVSKSETLKYMKNEPKKQPKKELKTDLVVDTPIKSELRTEPSVDTSIKSESKALDSPNHDTIFDMETSIDDSTKVIKPKIYNPDIHHNFSVKRKAVGSGSNKHPHTHSADSNGNITDITPVTPSTEEMPKTVPSLDQAPIELSGNGHGKRPESFSAPTLAPPPPMRERTLAKRGSSDNLRRRNSSNHGTNVNPYSNTVSSTAGEFSPVITVPVPASTATPYSHEKSLKDFLVETTVKLESSSHYDSQARLLHHPHHQLQQQPLQLQQPQQQQQQPHQEYTAPPQPSHKPSMALHRKPSNSNNHHQQHTDPTSTPLAPTVANTASNGDEKEPEPILSYRKGKAKQMQGFKFF